MSFLTCIPSVFVIGDDYEILLNLREPGLVSLSVGDDVYDAWNKELARIGIDVMITGHLHRLLVLNKNDGRALRPNPYPVIVGAQPLKPRENMAGTAITLYPDRLEYKFTDSSRAILGEGTISFN